MTNAIALAANVASVINGHTKLIDGSYGPDVANYDNAVEIAASLTERTGKLHLGVDRGEYVWPRFDVIEFDVQPGTVVSMGFNGDYYPQGKVAKVSKDHRIVTLENGKRFFRRRLTAAWVNAGTWSLIPGEVDKRNPEF